MFVLLQGAAAVSISQNGAMVQVRSRCQMGDCFGEMSLLTGEKTNRDRAREEDCEVIEISSRRWRRSCGRRPKCVTQLSELLATPQNGDRGPAQGCPRKTCRAGKRRSRNIGPGFCAACVPFSNCNQQTGGRGLCAPIFVAIDFRADQRRKTPSHRGRQDKAVATKANPSNVLPSHSRTHMTLLALSFLTSVSRFRCFAQSRACSSPFSSSRPSSPPRQRADAGNCRRHQEGAKAYLNRQVITISAIAVVIFVLLFIFKDQPTAIGFLIGAVCSLAAGYIGMRIAVLANTRTTQAATQSRTARPARGFQRRRRHRPAGGRPGAALGRDLSTRRRSK